MNKKIKDDPYFCVVPWVHAHALPNGERRLCCISKEKNKPEYKTLDEHWNSNYMMNIRKI